MISEERKKVGMDQLEIFDYFEVDHKLPKYSR